MSVENRLFSSDMAIVAIYGDATLPSTPPDLLSNLLGIFKDCSIKGETLKDSGRAISEGIERSLPYAKRYTIEIGTVVDASYPSLFRMFIEIGPGPYWVWIQLGPSDPATTQYSFVTKGIILDASINSSGEADSENVTLEAIQEFQPYGATNKIG